MVVLGNDKKVKELIKHAKTTVKMIPEKYVDYISPVDQVPAIFDLIEIIVDKRADNIKELINVYVEDEFKKEAIKHMYTVEKILACQLSVFQRISNTYSYLLDSVDEQTKLLRDIEKSIDNLELIATVDVIVN